MRAVHKPRKYLKKEVVMVSESTDESSIVVLETSPGYLTV